MLYKFLPIALVVVEVGTVYGVTAVAFASMQPKVIQVEPEVVVAAPREVRIQVVSRESSDAKEESEGEQTEAVEEEKGEGEEVSTKEPLLEESPEEAEEREVIAVTAKKTSSIKPASSVFTVPFYSQFADITSPTWQKVGCGIASLSMLIDLYSDETVSVDSLLNRGIKAGAYIESAGWSHAGLIGLSRAYGLDGESVSLAHLTLTEAFAELANVLEEGPVMVSVHYTFEPTNPIPHLVVVNGVSDGQIFYNDPAEATGGGSISIEKFKKAWKKRYISIRPV